MKYQAWIQDARGWDYVGFDELIDAAEYLAEKEATDTAVLDTMVTQRVDQPQQKT